LDDNTLIVELKRNVKTSEVNIYSGNATMKENDGVDATTLANTGVGVGIEADNRRRLVTTQRG
jgi:hypothetical protein